jgi:hypothetical protein
MKWCIPCRNKKKKAGMLIKLDMSKAYDQISWQFLRKMLEAFGFAEEWVRWIYGLISSVFFSILVNGSPSKTFNPTRGIRQGDPLSPYLYIILVEGLGRLLQKVVIEKKIQGIKLQEEVDPVTHLQFVDDNLLMGAHC